jgi:hypothetical protein
MGTNRKWRWRDDVVSDSNDRAPWVSIQPDEMPRGHRYRRFTPCGISVVTTSLHSSRERRAREAVLFGTDGPLRQCFRDAAPSSAIATARSFGYPHQGHAAGPHLSRGTRRGSVIGLFAGRRPARDRAEKDAAGLSSPGNRPRQPISLRRPRRDGVFSLDLIEAINPWACRIIVR